MTTYYPYLRGKQSELLALRELAPQIAESHLIRPIIEPVNDNPTTRISLDLYIQNAMPFGLIVNPKHGKFQGREMELQQNLIEPSLGDYENYFPILQVYRTTPMSEINWFRATYSHLLRGVIYNSEPTDPRVSDALRNDSNVYYHIFIDGNISADFMKQVPAVRRVLIRDNFNKQVRNSDYPPTEHFTDLNIASGNPESVAWGDYSIQGDNYSETGGPAYAVAIHHVHAAQSGGEHLEVSHILSDRQDTDVDSPGKIIEAVTNLVARIDNLYPNDTSSCREYRNMARTRVSRGLPYLKRLGIRHHLEMLLNS